jgi:hypothetical protein
VVQAREIRMKHLILMTVVIPILLLIAPSHLTAAYNDPKHCRGYDACFSIGYDDGYSDAKSGISPAYACVGHSQAWCSGYNEGFRAGNGGSNIYFDPSTEQAASINVRGDNNKISIDQQMNDHLGNNEGYVSNQKRSSASSLPNCVILCLNSYVNIK